MFLKYIATVTALTADLWEGIKNGVSQKTCQGEII